jgi:uncharacterized PurR-regulated membrane protein YhhQ (DUF165 family)
MIWKQVMNWTLLIVWLIIGTLNLFVRKEVKRFDYVCAWVTVLASFCVLILNT